MKSSSRAAFTLIEMLTVMAIIAILTSLVIATSGYVNNKAARTRAQGEITEMASQCESYRTDFTVSVDAAHGVTTGISAHDRARTIQVLVNPAATPKELVQPGHVFPLRAKAGGVLRRAGHTEASVDLARLAGLTPAGVLCEILNADGTMARLPELLKFRKKHRLKMCSI